LLAARAPAYGLHRADEFDEAATSYLS